MSLTASASHTIFADTDGSAAAALATWPGAVVGWLLPFGDVTVGLGVALELPLPPHDATNSATTAHNRTRLRRRTACRLSTRTAGWIAAPGTPGSVDMMRRAGVLMALVVLTLSGWSARADAHVCPSAVKIPVGRSSSVPVYVTVESEATPDIEVGVPPELRLETVTAPTGWKFTRAGQTLRFRGPALSPFTCPSFTI